MGRVPGAVLCCAGLLVAVGLCSPGAALAGEGCPNEQLRAENNSLGLPDCRAYEMVTPADKNSAHVKRVTVPTVATDGSSLVGGTAEAFAGLGNDEQFTEEDAFYRFSRSGLGWATTPLTPYRGSLWSIGLGESDSVWAPAEDQSVARLRLRGVDGSLSEIGPVWPPSLGPNQDYSPFKVLGAAAEAVNGVVFTVREPGFLWPFDSTVGQQSLYEYRGTGNASPSLVGVSGGIGSTALISQCGTLRGKSYLGEEEERNAVSESGGTVFFTAVGADSNACGGIEPPVNELFARIDEERTVAISEPSAVDCVLCDTSVPADAVFQGASADGSRVFFTTTQSLLGHDTSGNLYEYDFSAPAGRRVVRVSAGDGSVSEPVAEVQSVPYVSEDGSHVYFYAKGVLTSGANSRGEHALAGGENLYVYERDAEYPSGRTVFVTGCGDTGQGQVSPDGRFVVFTSACHLTAGDTATGRQVFQYDAQTGSMVRVSIGLEGFDDNGNATNGLSATIIHQGEGESISARGGALGRTMSDDGAFVFFQSGVALTPQATNGGVYEYHEGRVSLIAAEGELVGTSASGGDVFFVTTQRLVPEDTDTQVDFYDARVAGGFPAPLVPPAGCAGDACQGSPGAPPVFGAPSSVVLAGGGNLAPPASTVVVAPRALTRAQKLARALKVCSRQPTRRRHACQVKAEKLYGHTSRVVKSDRRGK